MLESWLWLVRLKGFSLPAKHLLVEHLGSAEAVRDLSPGELRGLVRAAGGRQRAAITADRALTDRIVERDIALLHRLGARFIAISDPQYPALLRQVTPAPLGLFVRGDATLLQSTQVAVVGSRLASRGGLATAERFAADFAAAGVTVTSGMALGIDASAHLGALKAGGPTVAVVANGIDRTYPPGNHRLQEDISHRGLLVTEYPPGCEPRRAHFPQRNRIISGLSLATVVVEAGLRSGSLITARLAAEQGRDVFAVPGSIHAAGSRGCHQLLRQGAALAESAADVLPGVAPEAGIPPGAARMESPGLDGDIQLVYTLLDYDSCPLDQIIERSGLTADQVSSILVRLELQGLVWETSGGYQRLPPGGSPE
jgi:DNA processing protein